jgi:hypothetical protein
MKFYETPFSGSQIVIDAHGEAKRSIYAISRSERSTNSGAEWQTLCIMINCCNVGQQIKSVISSSVTSHGKELSTVRGKTLVFRYCSLFCNAFSITNYIQSNSRIWKDAVMT